MTEQDVGHHHHHDHGAPPHPAAGAAPASTVKDPVYGMEVSPATAKFRSAYRGTSGETVDWLIVMHRLDAATSFETVLVEGKLEAEEVDRVAVTLKAFYHRARHVPMLAERHLADWRRATELNRAVLCDGRFSLPLSAIGRIITTQRRFPASRADTLAERARRGHIVDAHGDLRPEHIWLAHPVTIIDCLEFDARLRALDPLDEGMRRVR